MQFDVKQSMEEIKGYLKDHVEKDERIQSEILVQLGELRTGMEKNHAVVDTKLTQITDHLAVLNSKVATNVLKLGELEKQNATQQIQIENISEAQVDAKKIRNVWAERVVLLLISIVGFFLSPLILRLMEL